MRQLLHFLCFALSFHTFAKAADIQVERVSREDRHDGTLDTWSLSGRIHSFQTGESHPVEDELEVWIPAGVDGTSPTPVLYWCQMRIPTRELSGLYQSGHFPPAIHVSLFHPAAEKVPGSRQHAWDDKLVEALKHWRAGVMDTVDAHYPTLAERRGRALVGGSKGGAGVTHMLLMHPELFSAAVSVDGALGMTEYRDDPEYGLEAKLSRNKELHATSTWMSITGGWFWKSVPDYMPALQDRLGDATAIDRRHWGHQCGAMASRHLEEILTVMRNGGLDTRTPRPVIQLDGVTGDNVAGPVRVTLSVPGHSHSLHYTLDGSEPTRESPLYRQPFQVAPEQGIPVPDSNVDAHTLERELVVRARAFDRDGEGGRFGIFRIRFHRPESTPPPDQALKPGVIARYSDRETGEDLGTFLEPTAQLSDAGGTDFGQSGRRDHFNADLHGYLQVPETGFYLLHVQLDDRGKLSLGSFSDTFTHKGSMFGSYLTAGPHPFSIQEFVERGGGAVIRIRWIPPGHDGPEPVTVPDTAFFHHPSQSPKQIP